MMLDVHHCEVGVSCFVLHLFCLIDYFLFSLASTLGSVTFVRAIYLISSWCLMISSCLLMG